MLILTLIVLKFGANLCHSKDNSMKKKDRTGKNNSNWKGDGEITRRAMHYRVVSKRGKASQYKCAKCHKNQAIDWAETKNGKWKPLCRSCHNTLDGKIKNIWKKDPRYKNLREEILNLMKE